MNRCYLTWGKNKGAKRELQQRYFPLWIKEHISGALVLHYCLGAEVSFIDRQVDRFTRGLFYDRFREPMPLDAKIEIIKLAPPEISIPPINDFFATAGFRPKWVHVEPNIFTYFYGVSNENKYDGLIVFVFFETEVYLSLTGTQ